MKIEEVKAPLSFEVVKTIGAQKPPLGLDTCFKLRPTNMSEVNMTGNKRYTIRYLWRCTLWTWPNPWRT